MFDLQTALAHEMGLVDSAQQRASEQLMKRYYRAAKSIRQVNAILLQNLHARLFPAQIEVQSIDADFQAVDELLDLRDEDLFAKRPSAILDSFLTLQRHPELKGMSAHTLRALWREPKPDRCGVPARTGESPALPRDPARTTRCDARTAAHESVRHSRPLSCRNLGASSVRCSTILFHVYTVDEHILMVIRNLRRFTEPQHAHEYPLCSRLIADFARPELLYLAGLFHDIAKGRGGDHSKLGCNDARRFCRQHGLSQEDTDLVAWLVEQHLTMSATAQRKDITDPGVVAEFAKLVKTERRLAALYLLTVADIRGTSPKVWNAWKAKLLEDLFHATQARLSGQTLARTLKDSVEGRQVEASRQLRLYAVPDLAELQLWNRLGSVYFQHHSADEIAWHARHLYFRVESSEPVVKARLSRAGAGLQVLVYLPDQKELFARICAFFGRAHLSILEAEDSARRGTATRSTRLPSHDPANPNAAYREAIQYIEFELKRALLARNPLEPPPEGRISRHLKHFPLSPEVRILPYDKGAQYILEIVAGDRPGLLARIAYTLARADISVASARSIRWETAPRTLPARRRAAARQDGAVEPGDGAVRTTPAQLTQRVNRRRVRRPGENVGVTECAHVAHPHRVENAVQAIAFVLYNTRVKAIDLALHRPPVRRKAAVAQAREPRYLTTQPRDRQATLPTDLHLVGQRRQHRIDQFGVRYRLCIGIAVVPVKTEDHHRSPSPICGAARPPLPQRPSSPSCR